jgi:hypothetical protein
MATGRIGSTPVLRVRWSKLPTTGTTVLSGLDDNSVALVYDAGYEAVYRNGVLLSRGNDYTATNGTTVTLIDATLAGDVIEIFANDLVPLTDAISKGQYTAKGALLSASAASTPGVVTVGANDTVLTADSSTATGLKWATPVSGGMTLISTTTLSGASVTLSSIPQTYNTLYLVIRNHRPAADSYIQARYNGITSAKYFASPNAVFYSGTAVSSGQLVSEIDFTSTTDSDDTVSNSNYSLTIEDYTNTVSYKVAYSRFVKTSGATNTSNFMGQAFHIYTETTAISSITLFNSGATNFTSGTALLYGVK